jgi:hypothetical protein
MHTPTTESDGSVGTAAKAVAERAGSLARLEIQLALLELKKKATALGLGAGMLAGAALFGLFLLAFALATVAAAFTLFLPVWAALLVMCGIVGLSAGLLALLGLTALRTGSPPVPEKAIHEAKLTTEAIRAH